MARGARSIVLLAFCCVAVLITSPARAECGGAQQCIGVSTDPSVAPEHSLDGVNRPAPTLDFGNQPIATTSAARTILVAAVEGPAGTRATLNAITLGGANASDFTLAGGSCTTGTPTLLHDGKRVAQIGNACTILVTFSPATVGVKNAQVNVQTSAITRVAPLTGTGTAALPTATPVALSVQASTPTTVDLANYIGGTGTLSVGVTAQPAHGTLTLSGTRATYTPANGFLGADAFSYDVTGSSGTSAPAVVTISVAARPDPTADPAVIGTLRAQAQTARRFARAQIVNIQSRLESLHRAGSELALTQAGARAGGPGLRNTLVAQAPAVAKPWREVSSDVPREPTPFVSALLDTARTGSFDAGASSGRPGGSPGAPGWWAGGTVQFGTRDQTSDTNGLRFSTDGLSAGVDRRFGDRLALGMAVGYARDRTDIGTDGTKTRARGSSIALYGSYQPGANTFIDGLLGYGSLDFDSDRFVAAANDFARGARSGNQWFGSLAAGYELRRESLLLSPYGRLDFARARLNAYSESGAGPAALSYFEQKLPSLQFSLGLRAESMHETDFGWAAPRLRVELQHQFKGESQASLAYADLPTGPIYSITPGSEKRTSLLLGLGSDFILHGGLKLGVDYQIQRSSGVDHGQMVRVWLAKELDGRAVPPGPSSTTLFRNPVDIQASILWDDNVNRARDAGDKLADRIYSLNVGKSVALGLAEHARIVATGFVNGDKLARYPRLDRFSAGGQAELQYRASGEFGAPTFGLQGRLVFDEHAGELRSGHRYSLGLTYRQSVTDRIDLFGALAGNGRRAGHDVFDGRDTSARFNVDYALAHGGALYLGGEYRRGDVVSTLPESHAYESFAKAFVQDDAFGSEPRVANRYDAKTTLWTLGYNLPLGGRDSLDFSARRAASKPTTPASPVYGAPQRYTTNQYSVAYLLRF